MRNPTVFFPAVRQVEIRDADIPEPGRGQVLIETEMTAISAGTELTVLSGNVEPGTIWGRAGFPRRSGYCNVGKVRETGPDADRAWVGRRVQSYGGHGKFVVQPLETVRPVPEGLPSEQAVFATLAEIALHAVRRSGIGLGTSVVVCGLGLLGQMAVRFARLAGAQPVLAADPSRPRREQLPVDPAVRALHPGEEDAQAFVRVATRGRMADVVIELSGNPRAIPDQLRLLRPGGTLAIASGPRGRTELDFHDLCVAPSIRILGLHNGSHPREATAWDPWTKGRDVELFFDLLAGGAFDMASLITHRLGYEGAPAMYRQLLDDPGPVLGVVLDWATIRA